VARPEPECRLEPAWTSDVSAAQVGEAMRAAGSRGGLVRSLRVSARTASGRAAALEAGGFDPPVVAAEAFRVALGRTAGWQLLRSTAFEVERRAGGYRFTGRGRGHGVGLCVAGAARLARAGRPASAILSNYFPGSGLASLHFAPPGPSAAGPAIEVVVPSGEEGRRAAIRALATDAMLAIARTAGTPAPTSARLVFHPTVRAYARATGLPWWTAGASHGTTVDLLPPQALRRRGILERTVRHELAHIVIGDRLAGRPLWVQEGAAMFLAGELEAAEGGEPRDEAPRRCPGDEEISGARSVADLRDAYVRAAACFAGELRKRRHWSEAGVSTSSR
jgi:stage II sporulation protein D